MVGKHLVDFTGTRMFKASLPSGLVEMRERGFVDEKQMQKLVEENIGTLFPGLEFLRAEFGEISGGRFRPDTIAFDTRDKTFVVIEYKNRSEERAVNQAKTYLNYMKQNHYALKMAYKEARKPTNQESFNWGAMYAIVIAPEFDKFQIGGTDDDKRLELHTIRLYDVHTLTVTRVGGGHERVPVREPPPPEPEGGGHERVPVREPPPPEPEGDMMERFRNKRLSDKTRPLFDHLDGILKNRLHLAPEPTNQYVKYTLGKFIICSVSRGKRRLNLHYNVQVSENILGVSEHVRDVSKVSKDGIGQYETKLVTDQDFADAIPLIEQVIKHRQVR